MQGDRPLFWGASGTVIMISRSYEIQKKRGQVRRLAPIYSTKVQNFGDFCKFLRVFVSMDSGCSSMRF